eukprot:3314662-Rhodomonas_salina.3
MHTSTPCAILAPDFHSRSLTRAAPTRADAEPRVGGKKAIYMRDAGVGQGRGRRAAPAQGRVAKRT